MSDKYDREMKGWITDIQHYSIHDGPGIRTTVFLKGCPLNCFWCQNPETKTLRPELFVSHASCTHCGRCIAFCPNGAIYREPDGQVATDRERCVRCGECTKACLHRVRKISGRIASVGEIIDEVAGDAPFYKNSGGGMTISGGEVSAQPAFALELLRGAHAENITTAMETCGFAKWESLEPLFAEADMVMYDLKSMDSRKHREGTGVPNELIVENARKLAAFHPRVLFRMPMIPHFNDQPQDVLMLRDFVVDELGRKPENIELLKYNVLGEAKYDNLDRHEENLQYQPQEEEYMAKLNALLRSG